MDSNIEDAMAGITQDQIDQLIEINDFISKREGAKHSLLTEIEEAILDSGKLTLMEWRSLLEGIREIESLIPHVEYILQLKEKHSSN